MNPFKAQQILQRCWESSQTTELNRDRSARDVSHMWTGKPVGQCNRRYCISPRSIMTFSPGSGRAALRLSRQSRLGQHSTRVAVTAHENGHNLGRTHPNQQVPPK
jgi:hypothetical protein